MLIDMIHDNHGEPAFKTRYRDPAVLEAYGYQAIVIPDALAATPPSSPPSSSSSTVSSSTVSSSASDTGSRPFAELADAIDRRVQQATAAGLQVYFYADAFLLPRQLVEANPQAYLCDMPAGSARQTLCAGKAAVYAALQQSITDLFRRWPVAAGLIMRTGETYPEATPHMLGNPIHESNCPACQNLTLIARHQRFIRAMFDTVVTGLGKTYVHRTWVRATPGVPTMHDDPDVFRQVVAELPPSDKLVFSFKFTRGDFKPGQPWNPILLADWEGAEALRPKWVEFQCEREFEGKGAFPNFQPTLWCEFLAASNLLAPNPAADAPKPERTIAHPLGFPSTPVPRQILRPQFSLWGWSRGGGWGGPYVQREEWTDANVFALGQLYRDPTLQPKQLARAWIAKAFSVDPESAPADVLTDILLTSAGTIHNLVSSSLAPLAGETWLRDDRFDVEALWSACARIMDPALADKACDEKLAAYQSVEHMRRMFEYTSAELPNPAQARDLANTLTFYSSFAGTLAQAFCGFTRYYQWQRSNRTNANLAAQAADHLEHAQSHWQHHTQRHALLHGAPTMFHADTFWDRTNACLQDLAAAEEA